MKTLITKYFILFNFLLFVSVVGCKKKPSENPIDDLPPATQEGKNSFGCLIDGELFIPKRKIGGYGSSLQCSYGHVNDSNSSIKGYSFNLSATNTVRDPSRGVNINSVNKQLSIGQYDLFPRDTQGEFTAEYIQINSGEMGIIYRVDIEHKGKLLITKLDEVNRIVSGTFSFDAINNSGNRIEIREGRFDIRY